MASSRGHDRNRAPSLNRWANTVPLPLTSFIGRAAELAELGDLITCHRMVSVVGAGGSGKTRLAARAAAAATDAFPDGVWWIELADITDPDTVAAAVLAGLGLDSRHQDPRDRLTTYLADRQALLVLDNCEQVIEATAALLTELLRAGPDVRALVTTREPAGVLGERVWRIGPMSVPPADPRAEDLQVVLAAESVQLFVERATQARPGFAVTAANLGPITALCRRLDGLPLALELAAARVGVLPPERILDGLDERLRGLAGAVRGAPERQQTMAASVAWSHDLLSASEHRLFRRLAVFHGAFDLAAAEAVAADVELETPEVLPLLAGLVDKSLVGFDGELYRMLQIIRDYAGARLDEAGERDAMSDAHLRHHAHLAAEVGARLADGPSLADLDRLEAARGDVLTAMDHALLRGEHSTALRMATDLTIFWQVRGQYAEAQTRLRAVVAAAPPEPTPELAGALWAAGQLGLYGMDLPHGYGLAETARAGELATVLGLTDVRGRARSLDGFVAGFMAPAAAPAVLAEGIAATRDAGDPFAATTAHALAGLVEAFCLDRPEEARSHLHAVLAREVETGSPYWAAWHSLLSGFLTWRAGRTAETVEHLRRCVDLAWEIGDPFLESWAVVPLAYTLTDRGEFDAATRTVARSVLWQDRSCHGRCEYVTLAGAVAIFARGDVEAAARQLALIRPVLDGMGFPFATAETGLFAARLDVARGDAAGAAANLDAAGSVTEQVGPWYRAQLADVGGQVARAQGRSAAAEDAHHRALALSLEHGFDGIATDSLERLAVLAVAGESAREAARLLGAATALPAHTGRHRPVLFEREIADTVAAARAAIGDQAWSDADAEGAALSLTEAAAYASRARGERRRPSSGWAALTPTELQVVELAAAGLTNAQIAEKLFIATGTVKIHVHHVFTKLGISRRAELAALATERRLSQ